MFGPLTNFATAAGSSAEASETSGFRLSDLWLLVACAAITLMVQLIVEVYKNATSKGKEGREERRAIDCEERDEDRAKVREIAEAERARASAALGREDLACEELDRLFSILESVVPEATLATDWVAASELKASTLGPIPFS